MDRGLLGRQPRGHRLRRERAPAGHRPSAAGRAAAGAGSYARQGRLFDSPQLAARRAGPDLAGAGSRPSAGGAGGAARRRREQQPRHGLRYSRCGDRGDTPGGGGGARPELPGRRPRRQRRQPRPRSHDRANPISSAAVGMVGARLGSTDPLTPDRRSSPMCRWGTYAVDAIPDREAAVYMAESHRTEAWANARSFRVAAQQRKQHPLIRQAPFSTGRTIPRRTTWSGTGSPAYRPE